MAQNSDLLIIGGGLNGTLTALAAAQAGITSTLIEPKPAKARKNAGFDGRSYALALASTKLLKVLGLWDTLHDTAQPMNEIKVTDGRAGEGPSLLGMHFDHAEMEEGPMGYMVEDRHLRRALIDAVSKSKLIKTVEDRVIAQSCDARQSLVTLASGKTLNGTLIIGCDGRTSQTAERARITRTGWPYEQTALVCAIGHEKPHGGIAHQFFMPAGPLAILPLTENRSSIVWSETTQNAAAIHALDDTAYLDVLRPRFGDFLGDIHLAGDRYTYPLALSIADRFTDTRLALVGDAAHGVHPIAGQGLNAGIRDIAALAEVLTDARRRGEDIGAPDVLDRYNRWRRFDVATLAMATDGFNKLFSNDNPVLRGVRDMGMGIVNALPGLRRSFMREAAGLTGDLPRLLKGQQL